MQCVTCLEKISESEKLPCGHYIHKECISKGPSAKCHICRADLSKYGYTFTPYLTDYDSYLTIENNFDSNYLNAIQEEFKIINIYYDEDMEFIEQVINDMKRGIEICYEDMLAFSEAQKRCSIY